MHKTRSAFFISSLAAALLAGCDDGPILPQEVTPTPDPGALIAMSLDGTVGVLLDGGAIPGHDARGQPISDDSFFMILNGDVDSIDWTMPARDGQEWKIVVDTTGEREGGTTIDNAKPLTVASRSMVVLTAQARR